MAEAFFNHYAKGKAQAFSAGTKPASHTDRTVLQAMKEIGIDISNKRPKMLTLEMLGMAGKVITISFGVEGVRPASYVPTEYWQLEDPEGKSIEQVRAIRDEIGTNVRKLVEETLGNLATAQPHRT